MSKTSKTNLLFSANINEQDKLFCYQEGGILRFCYNDEMIYKISIFALMSKKRRMQIEESLSNLLLDRGVDTATIDNLLKGVESC